MVAKIKLEAQHREITGKEVKQLRQQGVIPANLYGKNIHSVPLQIEKLGISKVLAEVGGSKLVDLSIKGEKKPRNVLIREVQRGLAGNILHMDFFQVSMTELITVPVPVELVGENPLIKANNLVLEQAVWELQVKCLPDKIPQSIEVDISSIIGTGHALLVKDIKPVKDVTILNSPDESIVRARAQLVMEKEEVKPVVAAEATAEAAPGAEAKAEAEK